MSVALAVSKIGEYTSRYDSITARVNTIQEALQLEGFKALKAGRDVDTKIHESLRKELAVLMYLQGLLKEFIEYWKQVIQQTLALIKSIQELAQGAR